MPVELSAKIKMGASRVPDEYIDNKMWLIFSIECLLLLKIGTPLLLWV